MIDDMLTDAQIIEMYPPDQLTARISMSRLGRLLRELSGPADVAVKWSACKPSGRHVYKCRAGWVVASEALSARHLFYAKLWASPSLGVADRLTERPEEYAFVVRRLLAEQGIR